MVNQPNVKSCKPITCSFIIVLINSVIIIIIIIIIVALYILTWPVGSITHNLVLFAWGWPPILCEQKVALTFMFDRRCMSVLFYFIIIDLWLVGNHLFIMVCDLQQSKFVTTGVIILLLSVVEAGFQKVDLGIYKFSIFHRFQYSLKTSDSLILFTHSRTHIHIQLI